MNIIILIIADIFVLCSGTWFCLWVINNFKEDAALDEELEQPYDSVLLDGIW